jgi:hypothetical protein
MDVQELRKRLKEIDDLEAHYEEFTYYSTILLANPNNLAEKCSLRKDIMNEQAQREFREVYKTKVLTQLNALKDKLKKDTTPVLS